MKNVLNRSLTTWCVLVLATLSSTQLYGLTSPAETISDDELLRGFEQYLPELSRPENESTPLLAKLFEINRTPPEVQRTLLETIYNSVISSNPYKNNVAKVRTFEKFTPCADELNVTSKRSVVCKKAIEKLLNRPVASNQLPRIGCAFSGGGMRAAICTDGFIKGAYKAGLDGALLYTSSVSGSTWFEAPAHLSNKSYGEFADEFLMRVSTGILGKRPNEQLADLLSSSAVVIDSFLRRIAFDETPTIIDLYGMLIGMTFFGPEERKNILNIDLTSQIPHIALGQAPIPLYSAVYANTSKKKTTYSWVECSPFEVACYEHRAAVPAWAFGRRFETGESKNAAPALSLSYLMGVWGSAISISFAELYGQVVGSMEPKALFEPLKELIEESLIGSIRIFPAKIRNVTYHLDKAPDPTTRMHTIIDAGLAVNVSVVPLLQRNLDIIIVCDFSSDIDNCQELRKAEEYARKNNLPFPKIDYTGAADRPYTIFGDQTGTAPIIIYVPLLKNPRYLPNFDPRVLMGAGQFMNVTNFAYNIEQAKQVAGLLEFTVAELKNDLVKLINQVVDKKGQTA